ncbi:MULTISPECIES: hypothetical protein [Methanosarcina]|uniref:hypothetical protein n=1 Tax=Methanosarcina TaxID=2207 RepID=UPI00114C9853|nr:MULTISPECIES: hypothetical protein [Methanosarcina]
MSEAKRASCCCDYIATPRNSTIFCDPDAKLGQRNDPVLPRRNSGDGTRKMQTYISSLLYYRRQ